MHIQTIVHYKSFTYESKVSEDLTEQEVKEIEKYMADLIGGIHEVLMIETNEGKTYFPKKVLDECIITIAPCDYQNKRL